MTELAQKAVAEIMKAVRELKNPSAPIAERYEKGDFFMVNIAGSTIDVCEPKEDGGQIDLVVRR
jgi:hypothetical protein